MKKEYSEKVYQEKLEMLVELEGYGDDEYTLLEDAISDSVVMGICMNADCDYTGIVEPDNDSGYCEICKSNTVCSPLILAGII